VILCGREMGGGKRRGDVGVRGGCRAARRGRGTGGKVGGIGRTGLGGERDEK